MDAKLIASFGAVGSPLKPFNEEYGFPSRLFRGLRKLALDRRKIGFLLQPHSQAIVLDPTYEHDRWGTEPRDTIREFRAYTVSFDSADDDGDEVADVWAIPYWVSFEIKKYDGDLGKGPSRPSWMTEKPLHELGIAADDDSYHFTEVWRDSNPFSKFNGYDRGHLCPKYTAFRMGKDADWNTHTTWTAVVTTNAKRHVITKKNLRMPVLLGSLEPSSRATLRPGRLAV